MVVYVSSGLYDVFQLPFDQFADIVELWLGLDVDVLQVYVGLYDNDAHVHEGQYHVGVDLLSVDLCVDAVQLFVSLNDDPGFVCPDDNEVVVLLVECFFGDYVQLIDLIVVGNLDQVLVVFSVAGIVPVGVVGVGDNCDEEVQFVMVVFVVLELDDFGID